MARWGRQTSLLGRARSTAAAGTGLLVGLLLLAGVPTSQAAFTSSSARGGTFASTTLAPASDLTATRTCPVLPAFRSGNAAQGNKAAVVNKPAGLAAGDYMVAFAFSEAPVVPPDGWTTLQTFTPATSVLHSGVYGRLAGSSEPSSYTFTVTNGSATLGAWVGVDAATPVNVSALHRNGTASTTSSTPSLSTTMGPTLLVLGAGVGTTGVQVPASSTRRVTNLLTSSEVVLADEPFNSTGATGSRGFTHSASATSQAMAVALQPATPGSVALSWTATPDTWADGYRLVRTGDGNTATATLTGRSTTTHDDSPPSGSSAYTYELRAAAGNWRSTAVTVSTPGCS